MCAKSRSGSCKKWPTVVASYAYCLLSYREHATLICCLCRPTVTLHQGQRNEHEHIGHPKVYRHAKFECNSLNIVQDIAS